MTSPAAIPLSPGWPKLRPQPLPLTVRPVPDETLHSYLRRLGAANRINGPALESYLIEHKRDPVPVEALAALSGQSAHALRYAILELTPHQQRAQMIHLAGRPHPGVIRGTKCGACMQARGITDYDVTCWRRSEDVICHRHRRWTAGPWQIDLTGHPAIIGANRRHRRLIHRLGRRTVFRAFNDATEIQTEWIRRGRHRTHFENHVSPLLGSRPSAHITDPEVIAAQYRPIVALTRLLASPYWRPLPLRGSTGTSAFVHELRRTVAPNYVWDNDSYRGYTDPLIRLFKDDLSGGEYAYVPRAPTDAIEIQQVASPPSPGRAT